MLPATGNLGGALLSETLDVSERVLSLSLHLAAGIVLAVVGLELMPEALAGSPAWIPIVAFVAGGGFFVLLDRALGFVQARLSLGEKASGPLAIFSGVSLDLFSDGVMIGTGTVLNPARGLLLAAAFTIPILVGATLGYFALRDAPEIVTLSVLALTGGALATVVVEEMIPEAHEGETSRLGAIFFTAGFATFAAISVYVGV